MSTNKRREIMWRMWVAILIPVLAGCAIVFQSFKIQVYEGDEYRALADSLTIVSKVIEPERGNIYAEDGSLLSTSLPYFEIRMDFQSEPMTDAIFDANVDSLAYMLSVKVAGMSKKAYKEELIANRLNGNRYYLIKRNVTYPELKEIYQWPFFKLGRYKSGMIVLQKSRRITPFGVLAARTIGYNRIVPNPDIPNRMDTLRVGIEGKFNEYLAGMEGQMLMQRISGGNYIPLKDDTLNIEPKAGQDVVMTLDINIQDVAESALKSALVSSNADNGCAVVMEVKTGKIKAIANLTYRKEIGRYTEYYNYAVGANTEPGSTFKLMSMAALIDDGFVKDVNKEMVDIEGGVKEYADRTMRDVHRFSEDVITIREAFAHSSNVGISSLVTEKYGSNPSKFYDKLVDMHLNNPVGIEITGETKPTIHPPSEWSLVSLPWMSTGYEVQLSPLQMLTFYNAIANEGKMMKPYLVSSIREFDKTVETFKPIVIDREVVSPSTVIQLKILLEAVFIEGSAKHLKSDGQLTMAGKTGTAQIANQNNYQDKIYQASFAGYFPADEPLYSCIVVVNNPRNGYYGGSVAGPAFAEIANKIYANSTEMHNSIQSNPLVADYTIPRIGNLSAIDAKTIYNNLGFSFHSEINSEYGVAKKANNDMTLTANNVLAGLVPNVVGMDLKDALYIAENSGLKVQIYGMGKVVKQSLTAGENFNKGQTITLTLD